MSRRLILRSLLAFALLLAVSVGAGAALGSRRVTSPLAAVGGPSDPAPSDAITLISPAPTRRPPPPARAAGSSTFWYAETGTPVRGSAGRLQRYRVAVEV